MAYLPEKIIIFGLITLLAVSQTTLPSPDPSWDDYKVKSCCPKGFV